MSNKERIRALLKSIETGDPEPISVVNEAKYIQHNPQTHEGSEGLAALFKRLSQTNPKVNIVRAFEDGDFVFAHAEYDFSRRNIGFEVFRFDQGQAVEHWDNIQPRLGPNAAGHDMVGGPTEVRDPELTEDNRAAIHEFVQCVLIARRVDRLGDWITPGIFTEHNPHLTDELPNLARHLSNAGVIDYQIIHRVLAEGDFVLSVCEGRNSGQHSAFYDLFRLSGGRIVEHWDTTEKVAPASEWKNDNGKF